MAFDWQDYLNLVQFPQGQAIPGVGQEAAARSSVSRAYFAAFCHARNYARDWLAFRPRNDGDDHGRLRAHLNQRRRRGDADRLDRLRQWRNECDYLDDLTVDLPATVAAAITTAQTVFTSLGGPRQKPS
jgi:hypothetical protein